VTPKVIHRQVPAHHHRVARAPPTNFNFNKILNKIAVRQQCTDGNNELIKD
jgi:hypothetical protein